MQKQKEWDYFWERKKEYTYFKLTVSSSSVSFTLWWNTSVQRRGAQEAANHLSGSDSGREQQSYRKSKITLLMCSDLNLQKQDKICSIFTYCLFIMKCICILVLFCYQLIVFCFVLISFWISILMPLVKLVMLPLSMKCALHTMSQFR